MKCAEGTDVNLGSSVVTCPSCQKKNRVPDVALGRPGCAHCQRALPWIVEADDSTFSDAIVCDLIVLVEEYANWSKPSLLVTPIVNQIAQDYSGRLKLVRVNADRSRRIEVQYKLKGPPTLVFLKDGHVLEHIFGAQPDKFVRRQLDSLFMARV